MVEKYIVLMKFLQSFSSLLNCTHTHNVNASQSQCKVTDHNQHDYNNKKKSHCAHACSRSRSLSRHFRLLVAVFFFLLALKNSQLIFCLSLASLGNSFSFSDTLQYDYHVNTTVLNNFTVSAQNKTQCYKARG